MDTAKSIRLLAVSLIITNGILHLALAIYATEMEIAVMVVFGLLYCAIGIGLFTTKRIFNYLGVIIPLVGIFLGTYSYIAIKPETITLFLVAIDIIVILCSLYLILHKT